VTPSAWTKVRPAAVAGLFYPADPTELRLQIHALLEASEPPTTPPPKAVIAPHAGYAYSGPVAASAYAAVALGAEVIRRVVLMGPSHRVAFQGLAVPEVIAFDTPLGAVPLDTEGVARAFELEAVTTIPRAHANEHSLEVHLPFLQEVLGDFRLVPLLAGQVDDAGVAGVLSALWGGRETLVVVSSDLSHYLPYSEAQALDRATADAIERLDPDAIGYDHACGRIPVSGLVTVAVEKGLTVHTVDLRNSGDTTGGFERVVGYGAFLFHEPV
jgi:MEMO1 family protein